MTKKSVLIAAGGFICGGLLAGFGFAWFYRSSADEGVTAFGDEAVAISTSASASSRLVVLQALRTNDVPKAIRLLEMGLSGDIVTLVHAPDSLSGEHRELAAGVLRRAKAYRAQFAYETGNDTIDAAVRDALGRIK